MISEKELINLLEDILVEESVVDLPEDNSDFSTELDAPNSGAAWVKEGIVFVRDPVGEGSLATIAPGPGVELYVNGVLVINLIVRQHEEAGTRLAQGEELSVLLKEMK